MMRTTVWVGIALMLSGGCMSKPSSSPPPAAAGTLEGKVTIGPIFPHERIGVSNEAGAEIYTAHTLVVLAADGSTKIKEMKLDGNGRFKTDLPEGNYILDVLPHDIGMKMTWNRTHPVTIQSGQTTTADIDIDTGIR